MSTNRYRELKQTGAQTVATGCPFCMRMITEETAKEEPETPCKCSMSLSWSRQGCKNNMRRHAYWFALGVGLLLGASACRAEPRVTISSRQRGDVAFQVEVADTPAKRELGLQYRRDLAPDRGMIFLFPDESRQTFWMKNTPIPLDMIFIGRDMKVVGIVAQTVPFSLDARSVDGAEPVCVGNQRRAWLNATASKPAIEFVLIRSRLKVGGNKKGPRAARLWIPKTDLR